MHTKFKVGKRISLTDLDDADRELVEAALDVSGNAYAPYSGFAVGAAVRGGRSAKIYTGSNLENAAYGVVICAEVAAVTAANTAGEFDIDSVAVVGHKFRPPADSSQIVTPCGRCRQIISEAAELANRNIRIFSCNGDLSEIDQSTIFELLPDAFGPLNVGLPDTWPELQQALRSRVAKLKR